MSDTQRIDKWLWHARFFKTRTLAAKVVNAGKVRLNATKITKASTNIKLEDGLSFMQGDTLRIVRISNIGSRRGPATEAQTLYEDLTPEPESHKTPIHARVGIRPTKKDRRALDAVRNTAP